MLTALRVMLEVEQPECWARFVASLTGPTPQEVRSFVPAMTYQGPVSDAPAALRPFEKTSSSPFASPRSGGSTVRDRYRRVLMDSVEDERADESWSTPQSEGFHYVTPERGRHWYRAADYFDVEASVDAYVAEM